MHMTACRYLGVIAQIVTDTETYPSPVIALGSQHTVNQAMINAGGTVIQLHDWNNILGLEERYPATPCLLYTIFACCSADATFDNPPCLPVWESTTPGQGCTVLLVNAAGACKHISS